MGIDTLHTGDCLPVLETFDAQSIDLIYLDPPFFSQTTHKLKTRDNIHEYTFSDVWDSLDAYKCFLGERIAACRRVLKDTGSIFVHCDSSASHHIRLLLDEIFGADYFQSEIIWTYRRWSNAKKGLLNAHQTVYFYSKSDDFKFNTLYTDYSPTTNIDQILQQRERDEHGKSVYKRDEQGDVVWAKEKCGVPLSNVWDIPYLNPKAIERTGYPTQKPILLLEQIIALATDEGDIVLDPMCGSGTSLVAAKLLNRHWIGIDRESDAIALTQARLEQPQKTVSRLLKIGKAAYLNQDEKIQQLLQSLDATVVQRNNGLDGFLKEHYQGTPVAIRVQRAHESLEEAKKHLLRASATKGCILKILICTSPYQSSSMFELENVDSNVLVVDSYELLVGRWLREKQAHMGILA